MQVKQKNIRKQRILISSLLLIGTIGIGVSIALPIVSNSDSKEISNKKDVKINSQKSNKEKFNELIKSEVFLIDANNDLNLNELETQEKILLVIKNKTKNILSSTEKSEIKIVTKAGLIKLEKISNIWIEIKFDSKKTIDKYQLKFTIKNGIKIFISSIKNKIKDTNLTIDKDVDTSNDTEILESIKAQLQIENPTLSNSDLAKITDNISSLTPGTNTNVTLTITVNGQSDTINIIVNRPFNDFESVTKAKEAINSLSTKEITISATSGTITSNKIAILNGLKALSGYSALDLKGTTITIKDSSTTLTPSGVPFTIVITKNSANTEITSGFTVKRHKTNAEINLEKFNSLKVKLDKVDLMWKLEEENDINVDVGTNLWLKNKFYIYVDKFNPSKSLNSNEKASISLSYTFNQINLTLRSINIIITFDSNTKTYPFKISRTKSNLEKLNTLKSKFSKINKKIILDEANDLNLSNDLNKEKVKSEIVKNINEIDNLNIEETQAISVLSTSGIIRKNTYIDFIIKISFDSSFQNYTFKILRRPYSINNLNSMISSWLNNLPKWNGIVGWKTKNWRFIKIKYNSYKWSSYNDSMGNIAWIKDNNAYNEILWSLIKKEAIKSLEKLKDPLSRTEKNSLIFSVPDPKKYPLYSLRVESYISIQIKSSSTKHKLYLYGA